MESTTSSFSFLKVHGPLYFRLAVRTEQVFAIEPTLTLMTLRQVGEAFAQHAAIATATGFDAAKVKVALKSLERLGKLSVEGKARGTTYVGQGDA